MLSANLQEVLEVSYIDQDILDRFGYAKFEQTVPPAGSHSTDTGELYMGSDGIVRNKLILRDFTQDELLDIHIRNRRSFLLGSSDWTQAADSPLTTAQKAAWATYRQALRDLPKKFPNVQTDSDIEWPTPPTV